MQQRIAQRLGATWTYRASRLRVCVSREMFQLYLLHVVTLSLTVRALPDKRHAEFIVLAPVCAPVEAP